MSVDPFTIALLGSAAGGVGQAIAGAVPTQQSRFNKARIDELLRLQKAGTLGLDPEERAALTRAQLQPVRELATEARTRQEAAAAGAGDASVADLQRLRAAEAGTVSEAARRAGQAVEVTSLERAQQQRTELDQRLAAQAARSGDIVEGVVGAAGGVASTLGGLGQLRELGLVGRPVREFGEFRRQLGESGFDAADVDFLEQLERNRPGELSQILQDTAQGGPLFNARLAEILRQRDDRFAGLGVPPALATGG